MCEARDGLHSAEQHIPAKVPDLESGDPAPEGGRGELVLTTLRKEARSMIRFRTGGTVFFTSQPCECGRTSIRLLGVQGRLDGMKSIEDVSVAVLLLPADTLPRVNHKAKWVDDRRSGVWG